MKTCFLFLLAIALAACHNQQKDINAVTQTDTVNTGFKPDNVKEQLAYQRAFQAFIWGIPAVNYDLMLQEMLSKTSAKQNEIIYCVPANVPTKQYWSATVYDRGTHALIRNLSRASCASNDKAVQKNTDGSVDVYFGPKSPAGKESNWVPTDPNGQFEILFRLYGPEKALFEKTWKWVILKK